MTRPEWTPADPVAWEAHKREQLAKAPTPADIAANPDKARRLARLLGLTKSAVADNSLDSDAAG